METSPRIQRDHALNALRATMMLLGLVLHSAVSYTARPLGAAWPYQDQQTSPWFDLVAFFIHLFRCTRLAALVRVEHLSGCDRST